MKTMKNERGFTPKEVFYQLHNELHKESVSAVKDAANTLIVVATLVITLGITGALSIPIKDVDSTLTPIFRKKTWYTLYFLAIEVGNYLCAASMMFYGSVIIPSSWEPKYEGVLLRQRKLMFGNMALSASLGLMFTAIVSGAILIYDFLSDWLFYFIAGLGCITLISPKLIRNIYEAYHPLVKKKKSLNYISWNKLLYKIVLESSGCFNFQDGKFARINNISYMLRQFYIGLCGVIRFLFESIIFLLYLILPFTSFLN